MDYVTFVSRKRIWSLYRGIGSEGELLAKRDGSPQLIDFSAALQPFLWVCGQQGINQRSFIQRLTLPNLSIESVFWGGGRVGALASSPDAQQVVALELPDLLNEKPRLWLWIEPSWNAIEAQEVPDISSRLGWLDGTRIVYESVSRRLIILDLDSGNTDIGPDGSFPAVARNAREWYAISKGSVVHFPFDQPFKQPPTGLCGFGFGHLTTLRVSHDGEVFTWTEPRFMYRSSGYIQQRGKKRTRLRQIDEGIGIVLGPYPFT